MAVWQIVASLSAEVAVHIQVSIVTLFPRLCRVVTRSVHERSTDCSSSNSKSRHLMMWIPQGENWCFFLLMFVKRLLCR